MTDVPVLRTGRLTLRAPRLADFDAYAEVFSSDRSIHMGGPFGRREAWREFATSTACWSLRGYGAFSIEDTASGAYLGEVGLYHPDYFPEPEIGWTLVADAEGRGVAREAAEAARAWTYRDLGLTTLVSYIAPGNDRSIRLAERLGARHDPDAPHPVDDPCLVYRHPAPEMAR